MKMYLINFRYILQLLALFACPLALFAQDEDWKKSEEKFQRMLQLIKSHYVEKVQPDKIAEDAIKGVLKELDPHSYYMNSTEIKEANEPLQGNFEGVGIQYHFEDDTLLVLNVIHDGPAEKAGVLPGDRIIYAGDSLISGAKRKTKDLTTFLKGKKGTEVVLKILRRGNDGFLTLSVKRDKVPIYSVPAYYMATEDIGYIKVTRFAATTMKDLQSAIKKLKKEGMKALILDLQGNSGGYLNTAVEMADEFLDKDELIVYTEGLNSAKKNFMSTKNGHFTEGKLAVLIDEGSASASEIVSGALQDLDRGIVVGRRSFGKGLVQNTYYFADGSGARLTTARYFTPSGRSIQRPYSKGKEKYYEELRKRLERGELSNADSIKFPDSLKYKTKSGRTVFGGGGIMPDIFVPIDTLMNDSALKALNSKNLYYIYAIHYVEENRKELNKKYSDFEKFDKSFEVDSAIVSGFEAFAKTKEVSVSVNELEAEKARRLKNTLRANIARVLWDIQEYTIIINRQDKNFLKAIEAISNDSLNKLIGENSNK
jgi:carboxyl-terminal processing protease